MSYITDAYGNSAGGSGSSSNPYHWNGGSAYYSDGESGLQKVGARYYDAVVVSTAETAPIPDETLRRESLYEDRGL